MDSCSNIEHDTNDPARGYLEGYYGKLLSWSDRLELLECLHSLNLNTYCYAPKEDPLHRLHWRDEYPSSWRQFFQLFCDKAKQSNVSILAGIAPGLDFNFDHFEANSDFEKLLSKARQLQDDGASSILVLWDDIDAEFPANAQQLEEGTAHARVVNLLAQKMECSVWTVPRIYASEIEDNNDYLNLFFGELELKHPVLLCGNNIVVSQVSDPELIAFAKAEDKSPARRLVLWDNFYANDYCPRRFFVGPWTGRHDVSEYLVNPTGLPYTDKLLLEIAARCHSNAGDLQAWESTLRKHNVPAAFLSLAPYFNAPTFGDRVEIEAIEEPEGIDSAIEDCLWRWKSPLAREWYPYIMSLKHDLALMRKRLPRDRVLKTQSQPLAKHLLG